MAVNIDGNGLIALGGTASTQGRLRLAEDTDNGTNYIELTAPASVGSDRVITFPDATTTVVGTDTTQTLTNKTIQGGAITSGTAQASTSGTSIDFTGIPSWVKRITVMFSGVSTNGSSAHLVQIGSGSVTTSGYLGSAAGSDESGGNSVTNYTQGMGILDIGNASLQLTGAITISNFSGNAWVSSFSMGSGGIRRAYWGGSSVTLSGTLDRVRVTTVNGTDTFDAGSINILFE